MQRVLVEVSAEVGGQVPDVAVDGLSLEPADCNAAGLASNIQSWDGRGRAVLQVGSRRQKRLTGAFSSP